MSKLIVILGPTSSGKSSLGIKLARKFNGEIISADSRQVYKGMDIGTGKVTKAEQKLVPHHLLDVVSPKRQYTVAHYKHDIKTAIAEIMSKRKLPFLVGGTPFYIYAAIDNLQIPKVPPNPKLRNLLRNKSADELFKMLKKLDPVRAKNIDQYNPRRLIRALEIIKATGKPVPQIKHPHLASPIKGEESEPKGQTAVLPSPLWGGLGRGGNTLILGIKKDQNQLYKLIDRRLEQRLKQGMIAEVKKLRKSGVSWGRLESFGLEYRFVSLYLQSHLSYDQMTEQLKSAIHKFSKRQMTWFKRDKRIKWVTNENQATGLIKGFLKTTTRKN